MSDAANCRKRCTRQSRSRAVDNALYLPKWRETNGGLFRAHSGAGQNVSKFQPTIASTILTQDR